MPTMTRFAFCLSLVMALSCSAAWAQDVSFGPAKDVDPPQAEKEHTLTPEMYRYLSDLQRYGGPQDLTRVRAAREADQRKERLAAMRWYGYSNSRPMAAATPFTSQYGPRWVGGRNNPYFWWDMGNFQSHVTAQSGVPTLR
jgi:hypothetical protein